MNRKMLMISVLFVSVFINFVNQTAAYDKKSVVERFTNASCGPCATINNAWYNATTGNLVSSGAISHIIYNVWWPGSGDPMYILNQADNTTRTNYYGVSGVPHIEVNANTVNTGSSGPLLNAVAIGNAEFAPFDIVMTQEAFSENLIRIGVKITRDPNDNTVFGNVKLRVALTEKTVTFSSPPGSNGESEFFSVCRKMMPNAGGSTFTIPDPGNFVELSLEYVPTTAFIQAVNFDSIRVVAFIQEDPSQTVYQSAMFDIIPDYVATISSTSEDIISENTSLAEFSTVVRNEGILDDMYHIDITMDSPIGWGGEYTSANGTFPFEHQDLIDVPAGDSAVIMVTVNPNGIDGYGNTQVQFTSMNEPGVIAIAYLRNITTTGVEILVVDASAEDYGSLVSNSIDNVYAGSHGLVSRNAINALVDLSHFQAITWSAGNDPAAFYPEEVTALETYLNDGGNLFINGQNIGSDIFEPGGQSQFAQSFYNNYLHADYISNSGSSFILQGYDGDPITDGLVFALGDIYERSADEIAPIDADGTPILKFLNNPEVNSIRVSTTTNRIVYLGIGFEQISDEVIRDTLMQRIINFIGVEPLQLPSIPNLIAPVNSDVIDSSSTLFVWEKSQPQVSAYWFELDTTDQFTSAYVNTSVADTTFLFTDLLYDKSYWWRVKAYNGAGWSDFSDVRTFTTVTPVSVDDEQLTPREFSLDQNYPNPFNPSTRIAYSVSQESPVTIKVYDLIGQEIAVLVDDVKEPGFYSVTFDALSLSSGVYIYQMRAGNFSSVKKMSILK